MHADNEIPREMAKMVKLAVSKDLYWFLGHIVGTQATSIFKCCVKSVHNIEIIIQIVIQALS